MVLICKESANAFSALSPQAFSDLDPVVAGVERVLRQVVAYVKIKYLMLMMVDPDVHFHVIPRYAGTREHDGVAIPTRAGPAPRTSAPPSNCHRTRRRAWLDRRRRSGLRRDQAHRHLLFRADRPLLLRMLTRPLLGCLGVTIAALILDAYCGCSTS